MQIKKFSKEYGLAIDRLGMKFETAIKNCQPAPTPDSPIQDLTIAARVEQMRQIRSKTKDPEIKKICTNEINFLRNKSWRKQNGHKS